MKNIQSSRRKMLKYHQDEEYTNRIEMKKDLEDSRSQTTMTQ